MSERTSNPKPPKKPNYRLRQAVAGTALATVVGGGLFVGLKAVDNASEKSWDKTEQAALKEVDSAWNSVVVLHEGATVRKSPISVQEQGEATSNIEFRLGKDQVIRIDQPIVYTEKRPNDAGDVTWLGFTAYGVDADKDPTKFLWVNYTEMKKQNSDKHTYIDVYDYAETAGAIQSGEMGKVAVLSTIKLDREHPYINPAAEASGQLAVMMLPMNEEALQSMIERHQIFPSTVH